MHGKRRWRMGIIAIDPGTTQSGVVTIEDDGKISGHIFDNGDFALYLADCSFVRVYQTCVIEMIGSQGMAVGREIFETCVWIGRFMQSFGADKCDRLLRRDIKLHLCGTCRAKDANVRQSLVDRYGATKAESIGSKKNPGPLYGISKHQWAALAVGVCWLDGIRSNVNGVVKMKGGTE